jgi:hypothetical protein
MIYLLPIHPLACYAHALSLPLCLSLAPLSSTSIIHVGWPVDSFSRTLVICPSSGVRYAGAAAGPARTHRLDLLSAWLCSPRRTAPGVLGVRIGKGNRLLFLSPSVLSPTLSGFSPLNLSQSCKGWPPIIPHSFLAGRSESLHPFAPLHLPNAPPHKTKRDHCGAKSILRSSRLRAPPRRTDKRTKGWTGEKERLREEEEKQASTR